MNLFSLNRRNIICDLRPKRASTRAPSLAVSRLRLPDRRSTRGARWRRHPAAVGLGPGNDINAGSAGLQKAPTWGPASLVATRLYPPGGLAMSSSRSPSGKTARRSGGPEHRSDRLDRALYGRATTRRASNEQEASWRSSGGTRFRALALPPPAGDSALQFTLLVASGMISNQRLEHSTEPRGRSFGSDTLGGNAGALA